jgi:hypothetical protein
MWFVNLTTLSCGANGMPSSETSVMMKQPSIFLFGDRVSHEAFFCSMTVPGNLRTIN